MKGIPKYFNNNNIYTRARMMYVILFKEDLRKYQLSYVSFIFFTLRFGKNQKLEYNSLNLKNISTSSENSPSPKMENSLNFCICQQLKRYDHI